MKSPRARIGSAIGVLCAMALGGLGGCGHHKPPPEPAVDTQIVSDELSSRVQELAKHPSTRPTSRPAPVTVPAGEKSTLIYTCRESRCETLATAIEGLISPEGSITATPALNVLVVSDRADVIHSIEQVVNELDRPVAQLLVEARVVEVRVDSDLEYELKHIWSGSSPDALIQPGSVNLTTPGGTPSPTEGSLINLRTFAAGDLQLDNFIRLLLTKGRAKILSSPNLLVSAGSEASIITGQEVPIQSATIISGSVNTTTQFKRVGIKLRVNLLQITDDTARLELNPEVSTVVSFTATGTAGVSNPIVAIRNVTSTLSMKDGEILTVGGLLSTEEHDTTKGIPILEDIPGVGVLFQSRRKESTKTQLIFFLRTHIVPAATSSEAIRVHKPDGGFRILDKVANPTTLPANVPTHLEPPPSVGGTGGKEGTQP